MSYKLKTDKTVTIKGQDLNGDVRAFVKDVALDREKKNANIVFKLYLGNKEFELANYNENVTDKEASGEEGKEGYAQATTDFVDYFDSEMTAEEKALGLSVVEFTKQRAYKFINDKERVIGEFNFVDWESDE